ncbi:MAG: NADP-dependent isocitrate dehydrogenase, partial [Bacteroidota bacterium]|nr:NADP-dependent isocitrate dehydrogenase [Bacteroidota bacterium]
MAQIIYTITDEAPALATRSFLPIVSSFLEPYGISINTKDISLASRILSAFPDFLLEGQHVENALESLGDLVKQPEANVIKLPNISASIPQLKEAISELKSKGYALPNYPEQPKNNNEKQIKLRYDKIKGSAVNPVLREGNSDRRAPRSVKNYAKMNPHSMGEWKSDSKTHVASMTAGDFANNEQSVTAEKPINLSIVLKSSTDKKTVLKENIAILKGEIFDATVMSVSALKNFLETELKHAKESDVLLSLHMKAT